MTAITETRKRSRDEDTCDFMPIAKRISQSLNNLTLTGQNLSEQDPSNGNNSAVTDQHHHQHNQYMAVNNQEIQSQHFAQHSLVNSYPNGMLHNFLNHHHHQQQQQQQQQHHHHHHHHNQQHNGQQTHNANYQHQSHITQSTNHSNGFHNDSHLVHLETNVHKHQQLHYQSHHPQTHNESINGQKNRYCPELTADENPAYYYKNKLLFDLHLERERRNQNHH